jgi:hypothetical protein
MKVVGWAVLIRIMDRLDAHEYGRASDGRSRNARSVISGQVLVISRFEFCSARFFANKTRHFDKKLGRVRFVRIHGIACCATTCDSEQCAAGREFCKSGSGHFDLIKNPIARGSRTERVSRR